MLFDELLDVLADGTKLCVYDNHIGGRQFMDGDLDMTLEIDDVRGTDVGRWVVVGVELCGEALFVYVEENR